MVFDQHLGIAGAAGSIVGEPATEDAIEVRSDKTAVEHEQSPCLHQHCIETQEQAGTHEQQPAIGREPNIT